MEPRSQLRRKNSDYSTGTTQLLGLYRENGKENGNYVLYPSTLGGVLDGCRRRRVKTLFLSPLQPQNAGGVGGGGGVGGVSRLRFPPGPPLRSSRFGRHPRLRQAPTRRFAKNRNLRGWVARAPSPLETWPTGPWGLDPATLTRLKTLGCYHNPQSADLEGR